MQLCNSQNCDTGSKLVEGKKKLEQIQEVSQRKTDLVEVSNKTENVFFIQFVTHLYVEAVTQRIFIVQKHNSAQLQQKCLFYFSILYS